MVICGLTPASVLVSGGLAAAAGRVRFQVKSGEVESSLAPSFGWSHSSDMFDVYLTRQAGCTPLPLVWSDGKSEMMVAAFCFESSLSCIRAELRSDALWDSHRCTIFFWCGFESLWGPFLFPLLGEVKGRARLPSATPGAHLDSVSCLRTLQRDRCWLSEGLESEPSTWRTFSLIADSARCCASPCGWKPAPSGICYTENLLENQKHCFLCFGDINT